MKRIATILILAGLTWILFLDRDDPQQTGDPFWNRMDRPKAGEGRLIVRYFLDEGGHIDEVAILSGPDSLAEKVEKYLRKHAHKPARAQHGPVGAWITRPIRIDGL